MITIGYSTRKSNPTYSDILKKTCGLREIEIIEFVNDGEKSLPEVYNEILNKSKYNIVVLCHDDLEFDTNNWGRKLIKHYEKSPEFGIIGLAGSKYLPDSAKWWEISETMYGIVNHKHQGKKWASTYSKPINNDVEEVVLVDGLFISFDKQKLKHNFDEDFKGFHFYDLSFCIPNFNDGVGIGVVTDIRVTHLSVGNTNEVWEENRIQFLDKYKTILPIDITNNGICETFIFCHDQEIILEYEESKKFNNLKKYRYVFLGNRDTNKIENNEKIIIAKNLEYNLEDYPNINAYTGWYALWKNNLITTKYVNLFEYDVTLHKNLEQIIDKFMYDNHKIIGYIPFLCSNYHFIDNKDWVEELFKSIKQVYKVDLEKTIRFYMKQDPNMGWTTTSNCTMLTSFFDDYMKWFEPLAELIKKSKTAGHAHERSITFYCMMYKKYPTLTQGLLRHYQMDSHGTQGHYVDYEKNIKELVENL
jgi:hypothetical protein